MSASTISYSEACPVCAAAGELSYLKVDPTQGLEAFCNQDHRFTGLPTEGGTQLGAGLEPVSELPTVDPLDLPEVETLTAAVEPLVKPAISASISKPLPGGDREFTFVVRVPERHVQALSAEAQAKIPSKTLEEYAADVFAGWLENGWYE